MDILTTEQNFQLTEAIDWIDTSVEEVFDSDDSSLIDFEFNAEDSDRYCQFELLRCVFATLHRL